uniref:Uncharacterized protein n=1 Tax=viral metagenome TaxID=1070528 RepID=A0A6H1ZXZ6_9ZZZZ
MKAGKWEIVIHEVEGFPLWVPTTYRDATIEQILAKTGGCGPGGLGDWLVPDTMYFESVFLSCQAHDWMYGEGETEEDKKIADRLFLVNMSIVIQETPYTHKTENQKLDILRLHRVMTYYEAVYYGGGSAFDKGESPQKIEDIPEEQREWIKRIMEDDFGE